MLESWQLPSTSAEGAADCVAVDPKLRPGAPAVPALVAANSAVVAGAADTAAEAVPNGNGAEVGAEVAGSGVLTAVGNSDAPSPPSAVLAVLGGN